jgi:DNA-binding transcriptional MocR family regulator
MQTTVTLYQDIAQRLGTLIERGTFKAGERVPSVRALSQQWSVSITTVLDAYRLLEREGRLAARPQSGYYVQPGNAHAADCPGLSKPAKGPSEVSVSELAMMVLRDARNPALLQLGAAIPNPALMPLAALHRHVAQVARRDGDSLAAYGSVLGHEPLRIQVARRKLNAGLAIDPGRVVITSGCMEGITLALRATCRPGDTVAIESPIYYGILQGIEALGLKVLEIPTHPRDGISLEHLERAIDQHAVRACLTIGCYNNPLGSCAPESAKRDLLALLARHDLPLIEDDIYGELFHGDQRPPPYKAFDRDDRVLLCGSFSKSITPGIRVGYIVPAARWQRQVEHLKFTTNIACSGIPQAAVAELLASGGFDRHLRRLRPLYARFVTEMADAVLKKFPDGTRCTRPTGGHVVWVELPKNVDALKLYELGVQAGMTIAPGHLFSATPRYRNFIRLNAPFWSPECERAIGRLADLTAHLAKGKS